MKILRNSPNPARKWKNDAVGGNPRNGQRNRVLALDNCLLNQRTGARQQIARLYVGRETRRRRRGSFRPVCRCCAFVTRPLHNAAVGLRWMPCLGQGDSSWVGLGVHNTESDATSRRAVAGTSRLRLVMA